ncbi:MAG: VWA domain-containing protein [Myxococcota bacterium]|nr:VWA domain-containing protein [Myxococcota bacterium]
MRLWLLGLSIVACSESEQATVAEEEKAQTPSETVLEETLVLATDEAEPSAVEEEESEPSAVEEEEAEPSEVEEQAAEMVEHTSERKVEQSATKSATAELTDLALMQGLLAADGNHSSGSGRLDSTHMGFGGGGSVNGLGGLGTKGIGKGRGSATGTTQYKRSRVLRGESMPVLPSSQEEYTDHGVSRFVNTMEDRKSTFSIDVDTASYTIARKKINNGQLPPIGAVRVEEFVNYFPYDYPAPSAEPFMVHMDAMPDPIREGSTIFRVGVQSKRYSKTDRPPLNLTFLIDVSGSMRAEDKLPLAKQSLRMLLETLREDDSISIATYAGRTAQVLPPTSGGNKKAILAAINRMEANGSTAMSSGLDIAYEMAWEKFEPNKENRVVVLSDGDANVGRTSWSEMLSQIKSFADRGVTLSTIGFGMGNYKDTRMEQLANKGDGNNYYIDSPQEASRIFVDGFNETMISIARDVKIQVEFDPNVVESYRLIGYENRDIADKDFRNDRVDAGEVGAGHSVTAVYELKLQQRSGSLATMRLRYEKPGRDNKATERVWSFAADQVSMNPNAKMRLAYTAACFAEVLRKSPYAHGISLDSLQTFLKEGKRSAKSEELLSLMEKAESIREQSLHVELR